jgi:rhodanese-related sulfurtransferase
MREAYRIISRAMVVVAFSAGIAFCVNAARENRLPIVMPFPPEYKCPSGLDAVRPVAAVNALETFGHSDTVFVDARNEEEFERGHIEGSINIPYLFMDPTSNEVLRPLRPYKMIIIYCNSRDAQLSRLMSAELAQGGLKGVTYLEGGALAWIAAGGRFTGQRPQGYEEIR